MPVRFAMILLIAWSGVGAGPAPAQEEALRLPTAEGALTKVSSHLIRARALAAQGRSAAEIAAALPILELRDGLPRVAIRLERLTPALVEELRGRGLRIDSVHLGYARAYGRLDPADLDAIAALSEVVTIQPMPRRGTRIGSALNQADVTMNTNDVRTMFGHDGTGVEVGVLSDSFRDIDPMNNSVSGAGCNRFVTGTDSQDFGDLPNGASDVASLDDGPGGGSDEGRAMAELIFDIAQGATFSFHSAFNTEADFAGGITELRNCGANLIVDDVFWTGQAFFQDDIIAQAAQAAVEAGVPYFSAAGNDATFGVQDAFLDSDPAVNACNKAQVPTDDDLHDFGGGDHFAAITLPDDCDIYAELQWAEPFQSLGGGPGASSDLDLFLLSSPQAPFGVVPSNILGLSTTPQASTSCGGAMSGDPVESVSYTNDTGDTQTVYLAVDSCCGGNAVPFRIVTLSFNCNTTVAPWNFEDGVPGGETPIFVAPQIFGHPAAEDVIAVAASFYGEIDSGGTLDPPPSQLDVEPFSSLGGAIPFYFDGSGNPLPGAPQSRFKPELTGPDGTNTSFFGADIGFDLDPDPNFFGTSAAAPNSAAIAVLVLDATDLKINPLPLSQLLRQSAIDMEMAGLDELSGHGFTDGLRVFRSLESSETPEVDELEFDLEGGAFFSSPPTGGTQRLQANNRLIVGNGDFSGIDGAAPELIFTDGFESGDTSSWSSSVP